MNLEVRPPPEGVWVPLICALTWIRYNHAVDIDELLTETQARLGVSEDELRAELQSTWQVLADQGTTARVRIRGRPEGDREERELGHDDLRNCRWLSWKALPRGPQSVREAAPEADPERYEVRVGRYEDTFSDQWESLRAGAIDYVDVVVSRGELLDIHSLTIVGARGYNVSPVRIARAERWLESQLATLPVKFHTKKHFVEQMGNLFDLGPKRAGAVWKNVSQKHEAWTRPGRPPKTPA